MEATIARLVDESLAAVERLPLHADEAAALADLAAFVAGRQH